MRLFSTLTRWWNRHRTGEKTGAALTLVAIVVGVYFGLHTARSEDASVSRHLGAQQEVAVTPPPVSAPPVPSTGKAATPCPSGGSLSSDSLALSCEILAYCTESEARAPASSDSTYQTYEEQVGREASRRFYARLVATVGRLKARGSNTDDIDESTLNDPDQDCDSLSSAASTIAQLAEQLKGP